MTALSIPTFGITIVLWLRKLRVLFIITEIYEKASCKFVNSNANLLVQYWPKNNIKLLRFFLIFARNGFGKSISKITPLLFSSYFCQTKFLIINIVKKADKHESYVLWAKKSRIISHFGLVTRKSSFLL